MRMKATALLAGLAMTAAAMTPATDALAQAKGAKKAANCELKRGRGWAPTEAMARFQAWEIIAQTTGNWPIKTDTFKNEKYKCKPDPAGYKCESAIQVCKT
jgi:hypothetical protein